MYQTNIWEVETGERTRQEAHIWKVAKRRTGMVPTHLFDSTSLKKAWVVMSPINP